MEFADRLICDFLCIPEDGICLFICLTQDPVTLFDLFLLFPDGTFTCLQIGEKILKRNILFRQTLSCVINNIIGQSEFPGNSKGITFAGDTDQKPVSRA